MNPYQAPECLGDKLGNARFRLRKWFAVTLYVALVVDLLSIWLFGVHPILLSISVFILLLTASIFTRREASIRMHETGVQYVDLVQIVDLSWDRVVRVIHKPNRTVISSNSHFAQITIVRQHEHYEAIASRIAEVQPDLSFEIFDTRITAEGN